jgi:hypothetical protein
VWTGVTEVVDADPLKFLAEITTEDSVPNMQQMPRCGLEYLAQDPGCCGLRRELLEPKDLEGRS